MSIMGMEVIGSDRNLNPLELTLFKMCDNSGRSDNHSEKYNLRQFHVPVKIPYDELIKRYEGKYEIRGLSPNRPVSKKRKLSTQGPSCPVKTPLKMLIEKYSHVLDIKVHDKQQAPNMNYESPTSTGSAKEEIETISTMDKKRKQRRCVVDDTILSFTPEFCQRAKMRPILDDPSSICKNFTIQLVRLNGLSRD